MAAVLKNVYIFLGPELGKKQDIVNGIKEKFAGSEESTFYMGESSTGVIADTLLNSNLFSLAHIVTVKNAELIKKKDDIEILASCIKDMDENNILFLLSDEIRLAAGLEDAFLQAGVPKNNCQVFYELFEREKNEWLRRFFKQHGHDINTECIDIILEMVENNTEALKRECTHLINFLSKGQTDNMSLCKEDIEKWLSHNREESAFTLFSRLAAGNLSKALESISVMLAAKQSAQSILAGLAWCFRKLGDYLNLIETGQHQNNFELKKIGLSSPKAKDEYAAAASRYDSESAEACLALTAEYDTLLRSPVAALENILMDRYVLALINAGKRN